MKEFLLVAFTPISISQVMFTNIFLTKVIQPGPSHDGRLGGEAFDIGLFSYC